MNKVLIIQTAFIGDVILATSVVETWKSVYPEDSIDFLLRKGNESLLDNNPKINRVITWDKKGNKWGSLIRVIKTIRQQQYSHIFNLHRFVSSGVITVLSKAKYTSGFEKNPLSKFFTQRVQHKFGTTTTPIHEVERNIRSYS